VRFAAIFVSLAIASAQTSPSPLKSVIGEVTSIDAAAKQIKVKADDGAAYTIALADNTSYLRIPPGEKDLKKAAKIAFTDVANGDRLLARGVLTEETKSIAARTVVIMTKADLAQKHERDRAEWQKRGTAGTVTSLNADAKEITINLHTREPKLVVIEASAAGFRRYASDSVRFADAKPSSFAELQIGDTVRALGDKNEDGTRFKAEEIVCGTFQTIAATVVSVNAEKGEVVVTDLKTKKPVTVATNQNSMLRRLEERTAGFLARRMRPDMAGGPGAPAGARSTVDAHQLGGPGGPGGPGGGRPGGPGGPGGGGPGPGGGGGFDLQQLLERSPQLTLSELKKGDALIISSSKAADGAALTAISLVAGVEPFLAAAPKTAGQVDLGSWSLSVGMPEQ
jgi:hypothetical protein